MARVSVKYPIGRKVNCGGIEGIVTAIFIRGRNRAYEFSYVDNNGNPTSTTCEEVEIVPLNDRRIGFGKEKDK